MMKLIRFTRVCLLVVMVVFVALTFSVAIAGQGHRKGVHKKTLEVNVTGSEFPSLRDKGQPVIAVNPLNPNNLVVVTSNHLRGGSMEPGKWGGYVAYSMDRGETWTQVDWPESEQPMVGDPNVAVDPNGIFYIAYNQLGCPDGSGLGSCLAEDGVTRIPNYLGVSRSFDGGQTWSTTVNTGNLVATTPRIRVDMVTEKVYTAGKSQGAGTISVSSDYGLTWTPEADLPMQPFRNQIAVHDGILVTATAIGVIYIFDDDGNMIGYDFEGLPPTFHVSYDDGQTWADLPITDSDGNQVEAPEGFLVPTPAILASDPIPWVTADPKYSGRFAIMIPRGDDFEVYITPDAGQTWKGPAVINAPDAMKPWIEFGPKGRLGVMWRTIIDESVNVFSTVSFDRGKSFRRTLQINQMDYTYAGFEGTGGDEFSRIVLDGNKYAYITWGGSENDVSLDGIVSRVPISLYNSGHHGSRGCGR